MYLQFGDYQHTDGLVAFARDRQTLLSDNDQPYAVREVWTIRGELLGVSREDIEAQMQALITAYATGGKDLTLYTSDGTATAFQILNADTVSGVRVDRPPSFPTNERAALVTGLEYTLQLSAELPIVGGSPVVLTFTESIRRSGGGSTRVVLETLDIGPVFQSGKNATAYRAIQSGRAVGYGFRPTPPQPIWPASLLRSGDFDDGNANARGNGITDVATSWSYEFASATPLLGAPHVLGVNYFG